LPVNGLLNETEKKIYKEFQSSAKKSGAMWPWVIGGALLGI